MSTALERRTAKLERAAHSDEDRIVRAAEKIEALGRGIIDLNMGCSVSGVSGRGAGAGLGRPGHVVQNLASPKT